MKNFSGTIGKVVAYLLAKDNCFMTQSQPQNIKIVLKKKKSDMYINISTILLRSDTTSFDSSCKVFKKKLQNHLKLYINLAQLTDLPGVNNMKFPSCTEEAWAE